MSKRAKMSSIDGSDGSEDIRIERELQSSPSQVCIDTQGKYNAEKM